MVIEILEFIFQAIGITYKVARNLAYDYLDYTKKTFRLMLLLMIPPVVLLLLGWATGWSILGAVAIGLAGLNICAWLGLNILTLMALQAAYAHISPLRKAVLFIGTILFYSLVGAAYVYYTDAFKNPGLVVLLFFCGLVILSYELRYGASLIPGLATRRATILAYGAFIILALPIGVRTILKNKVDDTINPPAERIAYSGGPLQCYDTKRRTPMCWCSDDTNVEIFDKQGYHPETGRPLKECSAEQKNAFKLQYAEAHKPPPPTPRPTIIPAIQAAPVIEPPPTTLAPQVIVQSTPEPTVAQATPEPVYQAPEPVQKVENSSTISVMLDREISSLMDHNFSGRLLGVCVLNGITYPMGTQVKGQVISVQPPTMERNSSISLRVNRIGDTPVMTQSITIGGDRFASDRVEHHFGHGLGGFKMILRHSGAYISVHADQTLIFRILF